MYEAIAPNGKFIIGTLETIPYCCARIASFTGRFENGNMDFDYSGDTDVNWDGERTVERKGQRIFLDEDGDEWPEDHIRLVGPDYDPKDQCFQFRAAFTTPYDQHKNREGQRFVVLRVILEANKKHDEESLPMFVIRFEDGIEIDAWPEEVLEQDPAQFLSESGDSNSDMRLGVKGYSVCDIIKEGIT